MIKLKHFIKTTLLGGVAVILPVALTYFFLRWVIDFVTHLINPLSQLISKKTQIVEFQYAAHFLVIGIIIMICFFVGLAVRTKFGGFIYHIFEKRILKIAPGYTLFKETIKQFLGQERAPFSRVALIHVFGDSTLMTGFITDEHPDGYYTVYVPSGLNPTTGMIYHMEKKFVHVIETPVEETMRSIIGCGSGSRRLLNIVLPQIQSTPNR
jgi:uncharacterized membrane protein